MKSARLVVPMLVGAAWLAIGPARAATDGKSLYLAKCAMCHGNDGTAGQLGAGSRNFNDRSFKQSVTADEIVKVTHDGKGKMKGLGEKMPDDQARAVAAYILTLGK